MTLEQAKTLAKEIAHNLHAWPRSAKTARESEIACVKLYDRLSKLEAVAKAAEMLDKDIESDADGCYDVGHLKELRQALSALGSGSKEK